METIELRTGPELRKYRERAGVLLQKLAARLPYHYTKLSRIENGHAQVPEELPGLYVSACRDIARERAEAMGFNVGAAA